MGKTYFDLVKDCLVEMFYEEPTTWEDTYTTEGTKVKRLLNQALNTIVMGENIPWKFREKFYYLVLAEGVKKYPMPNGYIISMRYAYAPIQLYYNQHYVRLPINTKGQPICYWIYDDNIELFPIPNKTIAGETIITRYLTNDCAVDKYGIPKEFLECEDDEPIIPEKFRDILIYSVCKDFRRSANDATSVYYERKYREMYRAMLSDQKRSDDYPNGLDMSLDTPTLQEVLIDVFQNPRAMGHHFSGGNI